MNFNIQRKYGIALLISGVFGVILSLAFYWFTVTTNTWEPYEGANGLFLYYLINSFLLIVASIFIFSKLSRTGAMLYCLVLVSIFGSLFITSPVDNSTNLFFWTITQAFLFTKIFAPFYLIQSQIQALHSPLAIYFAMGAPILFWLGIIVFGSAVVNALATWFAYRNDSPKFPPEGGEKIL